MTLDQFGNELSYYDSATYVKGLDSKHIRFTRNNDANADRQCVGALNGETCPLCEYRPCASRNNQPELYFVCGNDTLDHCAETYAYSSPHNDIFSFLNDYWVCFNETVLVTPTLAPTVASTMGDPSSRPPDPSPTISP